MSKSINPSEHPNLSFIEELWRQGLRAKEINESLELNGYPLVKSKALSKFANRNWMDEYETILEGNPTEVIPAVIDILENEGLEVSSITTTARTGWGWEKQEDGKNIQVERTTTTTTLKSTPPKPKRDVKVEYLPRSAKLPEFNVNITGASTAYDRGETKLAFIMPDMQIGYHLDSRGEIRETTHDEAAIDVAHQLMGYFELTEGIDKVIYLGDNLDASGLSSHRTAPGFERQLQPSIDRLALEGVLARNICPRPETDIEMLQGNHEARLNNSLVDKQMKDLVGLSRAFEDDPVLSIASLCRFEESGITYHDSYPSSTIWLNDNLRVIHGKMVDGKPGGTASKNLVGGISTIFGHTHRAEIVYSRNPSRYETIPIWAGTPGCLCRIDGGIPSSSTGMNAKGAQTKKHGTERWHQGVMAVFYDPHGHWSMPINIPIEDGHAFWAGQHFYADVDVNGNQC